jgi:hypothetical protein
MGIIGALAREINGGLTREETKGDVGDNVRVENKAEGGRLYLFSIS